MQGINSLTLCLFLSVANVSCQKGPVETPEEPQAGNPTVNLTVTNTNVGSAQTSSKHRMIIFDLQWGNSWHTSSCPGNWDAAWVLVKYKVGNGEWKHATLSAVRSEHSVPSGVTMDAPSDGRGVYIRRGESGTGNYRVQGVALRWNYGTDNVSDDAAVTVKVFGVEMVYIPEGSFYAGDNATMEAAFQKGSQDTRPWFITSENAIPLTNDSSGGYYYISSKDFWNEGFNTNEDATGSTFTLPADYPKGFRAIYCMKYELTQQQYTDFLNTLTPAQAANRYNRTHYNQYGYTIQENNGTYTNAHPDRACGFLSPADGCAYADWAGLRPMSELEFEKICRGSGNPVMNHEFAWGTTNAKSAQSVTGSEADRALITANSANSYFWDETTSSPQPALPLNAGIFAGQGKTREKNGATYYGVMEMSGNLHEPCVTVGNMYGRAFTFRNGNGQLSADGFTDENGWPLRDGKGAGFRGGCFTINSGHMCVSLRIDAATEIYATHRHIPWGFRGVRTVSY
jgi:hypothetical protein